MPVRGGSTITASGRRRWRRFRYSSIDPRVIRTDDAQGAALTAEILAARGIALD
jgi:hypothetical protein